MDYYNFTFTSLDQKRLDNFLLLYFKPLPRVLIYRLIRKGQVRVNQKKTSFYDKLKQNDIIQVPFIPVLHLQTHKCKNYPDFSLDILYEDEQLLVINKPTDLATHGGSGLRYGVIEWLRNEQPKQFFGLAHRLDKDSSGCLLIAKKPSILKLLHRLFAEGEIKKTYTIVVDGMWSKNIVKVNLPLQKNILISGERMVVVHPEGKPAVSYFNVIKYYPNATLLDVMIATGRTHQIRVHAAWHKHPILGDQKYGKASTKDRLFLHAKALEFKLGDQQYKIQAPLPDDLQEIMSRLPSY